MHHAHLAPSGREEARTGTSASMQSRTYSKSESMPPQGLFPRLVSPGLASVLPGTPDPAEEALSGLALERLLAELGCGPLTAGPEPHPVIGVRVLRTMTG